MTERTVTSEDVEALVAGELAPDDVERVLAAIAASRELAAELEECIQMRALGHELGAGSPDRAPAPAVEPAAEPQPEQLQPEQPQPAAAPDPVPIFRPRRRRLVKLAAVLGAPLLAAAAAFAIYVARPRPAGDDVQDRVVAALAPRRAIQPRLAWAAADRHRPYDVARAGAAPGEPLSLELLAEIERRSDPLALAAAHVLAGDLGAAAAVLDAAPRTAGAASDRAAIALLRGDPARALAESAAALQLEPGHVQAMWNRALALQALGRDGEAAPLFDAVAARGEPGWAGEARALAATLRLPSR